MTVTRVKVNYARTVCSGTISVAAPGAAETLRHPDHEVRRFPEQRVPRDQHTAHFGRDPGERAHLERVRVVATPGERRAVLVNRERPSSNDVRSRTNSSNLLG